MKHIDIKNKNNFSLIKTKEHEIFLAKIIAYNSNILPLLRTDSYKNLHKKIIISKKGLKTTIVNRCVFSLYKKRLNKRINISRHLFLKFAREGSIYGLKRNIW